MNRKHFFLLLCHLLVAFAPSTRLAAAPVKPHPIPPDGSASHQYTLTVNGKDVPVVDWYGEYAYAHFSFDPADTATLTLTGGLRTRGTHRKRQRTAALQNASEGGRVLSFRAFLTSTSQIGNDPLIHMHLVTLDYILLGAFMLLMAFIGSAFGWLVKDAAGYLKGGNTIPWHIAGVSNFMSMFSTFIFVAYAGIAYQYGFVAMTIFWSTVPACVFAALFVAERWRRADLTTPVEYLERRFNLSVRQTFSWLGLLLRFLDNAVRLYASGLFLSTLTPLEIGPAIVVSGILITIFTMIGGLWAVVVMDTIQFIVLIFATAILVPLALTAAGGFAGIAAAAPGHLDWFNGPKGAPLWLLAYYVMVTLKYNSNWSFIQRLYAVRDEPSSRRVAWCCAALFLVSPLIFLLPAVAARAIVPGLDDPEKAYIAVCATLLPAGMMGLMLASMFSATVSALNSEFNVMSGVLTIDIYQRFIRPQASERERLLVARLCTVAVGGFITWGAMFVGVFGGAFEANKLFTSLFALPLAVPLIGGLLLRRPTSSGALASVIGGAVIALVLHFGDWLSWELSTLLVCLTSGALLFLPSGRRTEERETSVATFFTQIESPLPPERIPTIDPGFKRALGQLFALAFVVSGAFFLVAGGLNFGVTSGHLALIAGGLCLVLSEICRRAGRSTPLTVEPQNL